MDELAQLISPALPPHIRGPALGIVLDLSNSEDSREGFRKEKLLLKNLTALLTDDSDKVAKDACRSLVNISADVSGASAILEADENCVVKLFKIALNPESSLSDEALMCLCNLSRETHLTPQVGDVLEQSGLSYSSILEQLLKALTTVNYNTTGANMHFLGHFLSNLSQLPDVRRLLLDKEKPIITQLFPFTAYADSVVRRHGVIATLRNCCFDGESHEWLLGPDIDIIPRLLLPLAGPEEFSEEDNEKLPIDLQWLDADKKREEDSEIRILLLEALTQLCATKETREVFRNKNVYIILRELHKWERDRRALLACENLVDLLIRYEHEIGHDNLRELEVPGDLVEKFDKMDQDFISDT